MTDETKKDDEPSVADIMKRAETKSEAALRIFEKVRAQADKELDGFETVQKFDTKSEVKEHSGQLSKVLVIDVDAAGVLAMQAKCGNPHKVDSVSGATTCDNDLLFAYFNLMSNVDLTDDANLKAIGRKSLSKARAVVADFFMLLLVSELEGVAGTAK